MLFAQLPEDPIFFVQPHGAGATLGRHEEDTGMGMGGGKGRIQMPSHRSAYNIDSYR